MAKALRLVRPEESSGQAVMAVRNLSVLAASAPLLQDIDLEICRGEVLGIIGPSGAGKSTLLKALNRMVDLESPPLEVRGEVELDGLSVYSPRTDVDDLRRRVGILFQQPVVFPRSIRANALFGVVHHERLDRRQRSARLEEALRHAALWDEVKDRLDQPATLLSVGQQQRLCLARTLAVRPQVLLMDEPTSALDPRSTAAIEELVLSLRETHPIVLVTHDLAQAQRTADRVACLCVRNGVGELIETACCTDMFSSPRCRETAEYLEKAGAG